MANVNSFSKQEVFSVSSSGKFCFDVDYFDFRSSNIFDVLLFSSMYNGFKQSDLVNK